MKHLIASLSFIAVCCGASAQTKADSTKKPQPASTSRAGNLAQEKIWPTSNTKNGKVIPPHTIAQTRSKL